MANTSGQPATQLRAGKKKKKEKKKKFRWKVWESEGESENSDAELTAHLSRWFEWLLVVVVLELALLEKHQLKRSAEG